jgi:hypothetical protein
MPDHPAIATMTDVDAIDRMAEILASIKVKASLGAASDPASAKLLAMAERLDGLLAEMRRARVN